MYGKHGSKGMLKVLYGHKYRFYKKYKSGLKAAKVVVLNGSESGSVVVKGYFWVLKRLMCFFVGKGVRWGQGLGLRVVIWVDG